ncbi:MAG: DUF1697 domain-containing protein [Chloroflexi bacterium]|nr:DUF1697 domain-containing protein [Chloroflexota bacterium]
MRDRHVSLLRGINVGGHNVIRMGRLRQLYESAGCTEVETYLQSGNVVYRHDDGQADVTPIIESALVTELGREVPVLGRSHAELQHIVDTDPYPGVEPACHLVLFLSAAPAPSVARELGRTTSGADEAILLGEEFHLYCPSGLATTKLTGLLSDRRLGVTATGRNWRTVSRLLELSAAAD